MSKKKSKFTEEQIQFVVDLVTHKDLDKRLKVTPASKMMCEEFGIEYDEDLVGRYFRRLLQEKGVTNNKEKLEDTEHFKKAKKRTYDSTKKRFIVTYAQAETKVNESVWKSIKAYAHYHDASIHVIAGRYKNPTSLSSNERVKKQEKHNTPWDSHVLPYLDANRQNIHPSITICSDVKVQPTASMPLSGFNGLTGFDSCILGHTRVHMQTLPILEGYPRKIIATTGAVTKPDYTDTKAGKKGEFHHTYGFVFIELDGTQFHMRQIQVEDDGTFYDLIYKVKDGSVSTYNESPLGVVFGDLHIGEHDPKAVASSFRIVDELGAEKIVLHDIFNGHSISHHEKRDPFQLLRREQDGTWSLKSEIKQMTKWISKYDKYKFVVVRSNHDDFLDRWLMNEDWRKNNNRFEYLKYSNILAKGKAPKGIIPYILEKKFDNVTALGINDSYRIGDFECGMHGHIGANGSKGSPTQFKNLNTKTIMGHSHSPVRIDGFLSVGTLTHLRVGYNVGPSAWAHANIVIYPNGKASHVFLNSDYRYTSLY